jgi:predicted nucleic acid-binding protein
MILVDSSVWIDYFNGVDSLETDFLHEALEGSAVCLGDLVLAEVLQGFKRDRDFEIARDLLKAFPIRFSTQARPWWPLRTTASCASKVYRFASRSTSGSPPSVSNTLYRTRYSVAVLRSRLPAVRAAQ